jgi:hypothetical protein
MATTVGPYAGLEGLEEPCRTTLGSVSSPGNGDTTLLYSPKSCRSYVPKYYLVQHPQWLGPRTGSLLLLRLSCCCSLFLILLLPVAAAGGSCYHTPRPYTHSLGHQALKV